MNFAGLIQTSYYLAHGLVMPAEYYSCGLATAPAANAGRAFDWQELFGGLFTVNSVKQFRRPPCASVAVKYRDSWYYIDDRDAVTKATFSLLLTMTRVNLFGTKKGGPMLTLPVSGR